MDDLNHQAGSARLLNMPGRRDQMLRTMLLCALTAAIFVGTIICVYQFCRCPYCGKHIMLGVLAVKDCPRCRRNLATGKKIKKRR